MNRDSIFKWTKRQPFRPFQLRLTNGTVYAIHHPDAIIPDRHDVALHLPNTDGLDASLAEESLLISYFHIVQIEPLPQNPSSGQETNGAA